MKLPIYEISKDGYGNKNPEGPAFTMYGTEVEQTNESLLSDITQFKINSPIAYVTEEDVKTNWTAEFVIDNMVSGAILLSTTTFADGTGIEIRYSPGLVRVAYKNNGSTAGYTYTRFNTGDDVPSTNYSFAIVKIGNVLKYYIDGKFRNQAEINESYVNGNVILLGALTSDGVVSGTVGTFYSVGFSPEVELTESMLQKVPFSRTKDTDNSFFIDERYSAMDLAVAPVVDFSSFENSILTVLADGTVESFKRPRGTTVGNHVTQLEINESNEVIFTLDDDSTLNAGVRPAVVEQTVGTAITGTGTYYVSGELLPTVTSGNGIEFVEGRISMSPNGRQSPDYSKYVVLEARANSSRGWFGKKEQSKPTDSLPIPYTVSESINPIGKRTENGYRLDVGEYYVQGFAAPSLGPRSKFVIRTDDGTVLHDSGYLNSSNNATVYVTSHEIATKFTLLKPAIIELIEDSPSLYADTEERLRIKLEIFKVL